MKTENENLIPQPSKVLGMKEYAEGDTLSPHHPFLHSPKEKNTKEGKFSSNLNSKLR